MRITALPGPFLFAELDHVFHQAKYDALKKQMESMEMEVMEARLIRAAELNGEMDDDDSGGSSPRVCISLFLVPNFRCSSPCRKILDYLVIFEYCSLTCTDW